MELGLHEYYTMENQKFDFFFKKVWIVFRLVLKSP